MANSGTFPAKFDQSIFFERDQKTEVALDEVCEIWKLTSGNFSTRHKQIQ